jgi:hypothetical protein
MLKNDLEDGDLEAHIEQCPECTAMIEGYLERGKEMVPAIPDTEYNGTDHALKARIFKYNRGRKRILAFTVIGIVMGWLSIRYTQDSFILTKIIMAIPYKISEMIYTTLHSTPSIYHASPLGVFNEFFPQSYPVTFMAERITPVFIGGAIYGSIGYFTGNKRIFTLNGFLRFALVWSGIILLWIGIVFASNSISIKQNAQLKDINGFFFEAEDHGESVYQDERKSFELIKNALGDVTLLKDIEDYKYTEGSTTVGIFMGLGRQNLTLVNWEENYMIMDMGRVVAIPQAFADLVRDYYEGRLTFSYEEGAIYNEVVETEEVKDNEAAD